MGETWLFLKNSVLTDLVPIQQKKVEDESALNRWEMAFFKNSVLTDLVPIQQKRFRMNLH